jgi:hypothetical protein
MFPQLFLLLSYLPYLLYQVRRTEKGARPCQLPSPSPVPVSFLWEAITARRGANGSTCSLGSWNRTTARGTSHDSRYSVLHPIWKLGCSYDDRVCPRLIGYRTVSWVKIASRLRKCFRIGPSIQSGLLLSPGLHPRRKCEVKVPYLPRHGTIENCEAPPSPPFYL